MVDLNRLFEERYSARDYENKTIEEHKEQKLKDALRWAPSGKNSQPWKFIFVKDENIKLQLRKACKNQKSVELAPLVVVACGFPEKAYPAMGGYWNSVCVDVSIALTQMMLSAKENGLDTCWIGAFYEEEVKSILSIPENVTVVSLMTVGYSKDKKTRDRMNEEEIICYEKYS